MHVHVYVWIRVFVLPHVSVRTYIFSLSFTPSVLVLSTILLYLLFLSFDISFVLHFTTQQIKRNVLLDSNEFAVVMSIYLWRTPSRDTIIRAFPFASLLFVYIRN